ncbi:hypothetical protein E4T56_gene16903 [Termitomyces sp. T112]|nr:hypothetical protein E4T56_gene16903 [Termitomyces sp. T112]
MVVKYQKDKGRKNSFRTLQLKFSFFDRGENRILLSALQRSTFSLSTVIVPEGLDPVKWARFHDSPPRSPFS